VRMESVTCTWIQTIFEIECWFEAMLQLKHCSGSLMDNNLEDVDA
jgi:hypothetical protein